MAPRYSVGIDLGTTHTALAAASLEDPSARPELVPVTQLVARGVAEARPLLPSFYYAARAAEGPLALPWDERRAFAVGELARRRAAEAPGRVVASAKSWLCHPTADRRAAMLPVRAEEDVDEVSPVEASFRFLDHLVESWRQGPLGQSAPLGEQSIVLTVPASFDAGARELTVEAAYAAGLEEVTLLEEPQAALYAWIEASADAFRAELGPGDVVLIVDVGGGTTDFSAVVAEERGGSLELRRVAVGDHILLGGDNMDLALAARVEARLGARGTELDRFQRQALVHACRDAKERLLSADAPRSVPIALATQGAKLVGATLRDELARAEVEEVVLEGFFPDVAADAEPSRGPRAGLTALGLPYAADPCVSRHLAAFLRRHGGLRPTAVLWNGGVLEAEQIRTRLLATIGRWLTSAGSTPPRLLRATDLAGAVARGAAYYGLVRRGRGIRIRAGTERAYYVGVESAVPAVPGVEPPIVARCVAPYGMEEGSGPEVAPEPLGLVVGETVRLRFFGSTVRKTDAVGAEIERWAPGELEELAPIEVRLEAEERSAGEVVPVRLSSCVTAVGTLLVEAVPVMPISEAERWKVELGVRAATG